jgi:hypothetical protein
MGEVDREIHGLFVELLVPGKLGKHARREVSRLYRTLQDEEVLSPAAGRDQPAAKHGEASPGMNATVAPERASESARVGGTVREMFLRLATAMHPDRAQDEPERAARTEVMKELNRAYEAGDLARLLELERSWAASLAPASSDDDGERRCDFLRRANQALRRQLKSLRQQIRALTDSPSGHLVAQCKRFRGGQDPVDQFIAEGEEEVAQLTAIRDHVRGFRDGRISLAQFLAGHRSPVEDDFLADPDFAGEIDELLATLAGAVAQAGPSPSRRSRRRRGRR